MIYMDSYEEWLDMECPLCHMKNGECDCSDEEDEEETFKDEEI